MVVGLIHPIAGQKALRVDLPILRILVAAHTPGRQGKVRVPISTTQPTDVEHSRHSERFWIKDDIRKAEVTMTHHHVLRRGRGGMQFSQQLGRSPAVVVRFQTRLIKASAPDRRLRGRKQTFKAPIERAIHDRNGMKTPGHIGQGVHNLQALPCSPRLSRRPASQRLRDQPRRVIPDSHLDRFWSRKSNPSQPCESFTFGNQVVSRQVVADHSGDLDVEPLRTF